MFGLLVDIDLLWVVWFVRVVCGLFWLVLIYDYGVGFSFRLM